MLGVGCIAIHSMLNPLTFLPQRRASSWWLTCALICGSPLAGASEQLSGRDNATTLYAGCPASIDNFYRCQQYLEPAELRKAPFVQRKASVLRINLTNGRTLELHDSPAGAEEDAALYSLSRVFEGSPYILVTVSLWEGSVRWLVNRMDGSKTVLEGDALLSPDKRRLAVWSDDEAYDGVRLQVWQLNPKPKLEHTVRLGTALPSAVRWASDGRLCYQRVSTVNPSQPPALKCLRP